MEITKQPEVFTLLRKEWAELLPRSGANHFFLSPTFQETWWRNFGRGELQLVTLRKDDGKLTGLAPLMQDSGILSLIGGDEIADYLDFIVDREKEEETYQKLWEVLTTLRWNALRLLPLPTSSPTLKYLAKYAEQKGWQIKTRVGRPAYAISLPAGFEEYLNRLTRKNRHELRRKIRRLEKSGQVKLYQTDSAQKLSSDLDVFFRLHRESRPEKAGFMTVKRERFFRELAEALFKENSLSLAFLLLNKAPIAAKFSFVWERDLLLYNSGYSQTFSTLSPGIVLTAYLIKNAIENDFLRVDFMQGAEHYKEDLGGQKNLTYTLEIKR